MKKLLVLAVVLFLFFGCINFDFLGGQKDGSTVTVTNGSQTGTSLVITSKTNYSTLNNDTNSNGKLNGSVGFRYVQTPDAMAVVYFIPVADESNQGDAIFIKKGDVDILIDAGPDTDGGKVIDFLKSKKVDDIEILVSTHPDPEHYGGIRAVAEKYGIEQFWWVGNSFGNTNYDKLISDLKARGVDVKIVSRDSTTSINGMNLRILNPPSTAVSAEGDADAMDNNAVAIKLLDRNFCLMFTSDILYEAQTQIGLLPDIQCNILQMPYHGLGIGTSNIAMMLIKVQPKDAIVSGGVTDFHSQGGQQNSRISMFELLRIKDINSYVNYEKGAVKVVSDGKTYAISYE
ncbi:MAG: MBL fold metallo-hydrolase [Candidatus Micrarchaeia archaeon]|jgi:competence protein ComEC